jgi:hypothetical protein
MRAAVQPYDPCKVTHQRDTQSGYSMWHPCKFYNLKVNDSGNGWIKCTVAGEASTRGSVPLIIWEWLWFFPRPLNLICLEYMRVWFHLTPYHLILEGSVLTPAADLLLRKARGTNQALPGRKRFTLLVAMVCHANAHALILVPRSL